MDQIQPNQMPYEEEHPAPQIALVQASTVGQSAAPPQTITASGRKKPPFAKLLFVISLIIFLVGIIFVIVKFVVPKTGDVVDKRELVWWGLWEDEEIIAPIIKDYESANPGVAILYQKSDKEDYRERLVNSLARGQGPDIFRIHSSWIPMFGAELAPAPKNILSSEEFGNTFYQVAVDDLVGTQGPLALPLGYDGLAMLVNEEMFNTYGVEIPADWNNLRKVAKYLTIKNNQGIIIQSGASLGTTSNVDHWQEIVALLMIQNGGNPNKPNDKAGRGAQALSFYKQFSDVDQVWDSTLPNSTVAFATGRVAIYFGPSWRVLEIIERNPNLKFKVFPVPQVPKIDEQTPDMTYASYWVEGVWKKSKNADEAWKFLKFLSEKENLAKFYENASKTRPFGEPYPRQDMRDILLKNPILEGFVRLAPNAKSGFLHSRTFDGKSGINTSLSQYYEDALNSISPGGEATTQMNTLSSGVQQVLARYGLADPTPPTKQ